MKPRAMEKIPVRSDSGKMRIVVRYEEQEETTSLADRTTKQYTGTGMMSYQFEGGGVVDRIDDDTFQDRYSKEIYCRIK